MAMALSSHLSVMASSVVAPSLPFLNGCSLATTTSSRQRPQHPNSLRTSTSLCPSLGFANLLWFNRCYNAQIFVSESEPAESVVRRFRRSVLQSGVISECRRRRFFETSQEMKKRKQRTAAQRRKIRRTGFRSGEKKDEGNSVNIDDDDDFWDYAEDGADMDL